VGAKGFFFLKTPTLPFPLGKGGFGAPEAAVCDWKGPIKGPFATGRAASGALRAPVCNRQAQDLSLLLIFNLYYGGSLHGTVGKYRK
jgi:hypothetical protein